jgi:tetratricopeptide (TPR) repeat protein
VAALFEVGRAEVADAQRERSSSWAAVRQRAEESRGRSAGVAAGQSWRLKTSRSSSRWRSTSTRAHPRGLPLYKTIVERTAKGRRSKDLARIHFRLASIAEKEGELPKALEQYNAAYAIDAGHLPTLIALGRLYMNHSDWEKARRIYRSMLLQNLDPLGRLPMSTCTGRDPREARRRPKRRHERGPS